MGTGQYWYNGLENSMRSFLKDINKSMTISLTFNMDGLPIYNSSKYQFWPILAASESLQPFVVAIYYGISKPILQEYLYPFVTEINNIIRDGIKINNHLIRIYIKCFVCDTPARCFKMIDKHCGLFKYCLLHLMRTVPIMFCFVRTIK